MRKYNHSPEQIDQLVAELQVLGQRLLAINFDSPDTDQQNIRHHAYLRGKFDATKDILEDDFEQPEPKPIES